MMINKYPESIEESGNYLRIALKNISDSKIPYNPLSYLLWYEYASGRNKQMIKEIDALIEKDKRFSRDRIEKLIKKHLIDSQLVLTERKAKEFQGILAQITQHIGKSCNEIDSQSNKLDGYASELTKASSIDDVLKIAKDIASETKSLAATGKLLSSQLDSTVSEIYALRQELEGVKHAAKTDMLTGIFNRRGFDEALNKVLETMNLTQDPLCVILFDIDHFKKFNDSYGHLIGDNVLKMFSKLIKDSIKGKDIAARFGGEEFIIALPQTHIDGGYALSEQIRLSISKMNLKIKDTGESIGRVTVSSGIAAMKDGESIEEVIKRADEALYHAKNTGRDQSVCELK